MAVKEEISVLLIEDDPMVQEVNREFIASVDGFKIIAAAGNGEEGISLAKKLKPDLVILDIFMPKKDGIQTLQEFRKQHLDSDVIVVSAAKDKETIKLMLQNGARDYIIKPFKLNRIQQALEKYRHYREPEGIRHIVTGAARCPDLCQAGEERSKHSAKRAE